MTAPVEHGKPRRRRRALLRLVLVLAVVELLLQFARPSVLDAIRTRTFHVASGDADYITLQPLNFDPGSGLPLLVNDPELSWRMLPDREGTYFLTSGVRTNALGLRGPPLSTPRSADELRLLVLGDSVTFGFRVAEHERWSERLAEGLARELPGRRVVPVNAGVVGYSSSQGRARLPELLAEVRPDVVLACFGINDCIALDAPDSVLAELTRSGPERLRRALRASQVWCGLEGAWALMRRELDALANGSRRPVAHWLHYPRVPAAREKTPRTSEAEYLANFDAMRAACRDLGVPFVAVDAHVSPDVPSVRPMEAEYFTRLGARFDALAAWAGLHGVPFASARAGLRDSGLPDEELLLDFCHPSPAGHERVAAAAARVLRDEGFVERWAGR
jgi:lysophospholipase L1-like esterase